MPDFYVIITDAGQALLAAALAGGAPVELSQFAVGDGNGAAVTPNPAQTALLHELYRGNISSLHAEGNQIAAQAVIPKDSGGYTIREVGLYTATGVLFSVGNYPDQYKPVPGTGYAVKLDIRYLLQVEDTDCITLVVTGDDYLTREEADTIYLQIGNNLSEIAGNGTAAQKAARNNLALGTAATHDVTTSHTDITTGRVIQVGDFGLGGLVISTQPVLDPNYSNIVDGLPTAFYEHSTEDGVFAYTITLKVAGKYGQDEYHVILPFDNTDSVAIRQSVTQSDGTVKHFYQYLYSDVNQPTSLNSRLTVTDDDNIVNLKNKTLHGANYLRGIDSDGASLWYVGKGGKDSNNIALANYKGGSNRIEINADGSINIAPTQSKNVTVLGQIVPTNYGNFDARYLKDLHLGAVGTKTYNVDMIYDAPTGCMITGLLSGGGDGQGQFHYKPIQKYINGTWVTISG